jgi:methylated-DNA-protein-cysteine methyltransferase-like protein
MGSFFEKVYAAVQQIPKGKVASYGQIALLCGNPKAPRAVGEALHRNPMPGLIPCHRVVNRDGRLAPAFAFGGVGEQKRMLEEEGVPVNEKGYVNMRQYAWHGECRDW